MKNLKYIVQLIINSTNEPWWRIKSVNGKIVLVSETYKNIQTARRIAKRLQSSLNNSRYEEQLA